VLRLETGQRPTELAAELGSVSIVLTASRWQDQAVIEDDGAGFAPETIALDGSLTVESSERGGTTGAVEVPVR